MTNIVKIKYSEKYKEIMKEEKIKQATKGSSGFDLYAIINEDIEIPYGQFRLIDTGIFIEMNENYEAQVRSRSGLALKNGIFVLNSPGTIDASYREEIKVILAKFDKGSFIVKKGMRIAQLVFSKIEETKLVEVDNLSKSERKGGFGSTGT